MGRRWVLGLVAGLVLLLVGLAVWRMQSPAGELVVLNLLGRRAAYITDADGRVVAILPRNLPHHIAPVDRSGQLDNLDGMLDMLAALTATGDPDDLRTALDLVPLAGPDPGTVRVTVTIPTEHLDTVARTLEDRGITMPVDPLAAEGQSFFEVPLPLGLLADIAQAEPTANFAAVIPPEPLHHVSPSSSARAHAIHNADAWHLAGVAGQGVTVGVIDVGFALYPAMQARGEVPHPVGVRCLDNQRRVSHNLADCVNNWNPSEVHGTAVVEALVDIAPDASILVAEVDDLVEAVTWMIDHDVDIINYSVGEWGNGVDDTFANGPYRAVDTAVAAGITWINAAGNQNKRTWFGPLNRAWTMIEVFYREPEEDRWYRDGYRFDHDFGHSNRFLPGNTCNPIQGNNEAVIIQLRWDDVWGRASRDLNIELYDAQGNRIEGDPDWNGNQLQSGRMHHNPLEQYYVANLASGWYCLQIHDYSAAQRLPAPEPDWVQLQVLPIEPLLGHPSGIGSIAAPADSRNPGLLAVGAAHFVDRAGSHNQTNDIARYSSRGPTTDNRLKPDIVGVANTYSWTYGHEFPGTSQAAPHVAGLAALVRQRFPDMGPVETADYLRDNALATASGRVPKPKLYQGQDLRIGNVFRRFYGNITFRAVEKGTNLVWGHGLARLPLPDTPAADVQSVQDGSCPADATADLAADKRVLLDIRDKLRGANTDVLTTWNASTPVADFEGVMVDDVLCQLMGLDLSDSGLMGSIPLELAQLQQLVSLDLSHNQLTGSIPSELGQLPYLQRLSLDSNGEKLVALEDNGLMMVLDFEDTGVSGLTGSIPPELARLQNLKWLNLNNNQLTGSIPPELARLQNLEALILGFNQLTGSIPPELGQLQNLQQLYLSDNALTGSIPLELAQLQNLEALVLDFNQLTGSIPLELAQL